MPLKVAKWNAFFEVAKSRPVASKSWGCYPLKNGLGFKRLVMGASTPERGVALYGAWMILNGILHLQPGTVRDGWLTEDGTPHGRPLTAETLAFQTGGPKDVFEEMLARCLDPAVGWLEDHKDGASLRRPRRQRDGVTFDYERKEFKGMTDAKVDALRRSFPGVDVDAQLGRAKDWLLKRPGKKRGTLDTFLAKWMENEVGRGAKPTTADGRWKQLPSGLRQYVADAVRANIAMSLGTGDKEAAARIAAKAHDNFPRHVKDFRFFLELLINNPKAQLDPWPT